MYPSFWPSHLFSSVYLWAERTLNPDTQHALLLCLLLLWSTYTFCIWRIIHYFAYKLWSVLLLSLIMSRWVLSWRSSTCGRILTRPIMSLLLPIDPSRYLQIASYSHIFCSCGFVRDPPAWQRESSSVLDFFFQPLQRPLISIYLLNIYYQIFISYKVNVRQNQKVGNNAIWWSPYNFGQK